MLLLRGALRSLVADRSSVARRCAGLLCCRCCGCSSWCFFRCFCFLFFCCCCSSSWRSLRLRLRAAAEVLGQCDEDGCAEHDPERLHGRAGRRGSA
jgi:hypothetical protein